MRNFSHHSVQIGYDAYDTDRGKRLYGTASSVLQKAVFCAAKDGLLPCERQPFTVQNTAFHIVSKHGNKVKDYHPQRKTHAAMKPKEA